MKRILFIIILLVINSTVHANVSTKVYLPDGKLLDPIDTNNMPWIYPDIMVGTRLAIYVDSNVGQSWSGGLFINREDLENGFGELYCRGESCEGSMLPDAGDMASVYRWDDELIGGYVLGTDSEPNDGNWFVLDYNALSTGGCNAGLYDDNVSFDIPIIEMHFTQIPTRDFDDDGIVDFIDYSIIGLNWQRTDCIEPDNCSGTDINTDSNVDLIDLKLFADFWLERTR